MGILKDIREGKAVLPHWEQEGQEQVQVRSEGEGQFIPPLAQPQVPEQDFFKYRVDTTDIIEEISRQLKGEVLTTNERGEQVYEKKFDRWMNDEGINKVLHVIYSNGLNKNVFLGNLTHDCAYSLCT